MKRTIVLPAISIAITALVLIMLNEFTPLSVPTPWAYLCLIAALLGGIWLAKRNQRREGKI